MRVHTSSLSLVSVRNALLLLILAVGLSLAAQPASSQVRLDIRDVEGEAGTTVSIPIAVDGLSETDMTAYEFAVPFDSSVVELTGASTENAVTPSAPSVNVEAGTLRVAFSASEALGGDGPLLTLEGTLTGAGTDRLGFQSLAVFGLTGSEVASEGAGGVVTSRAPITGRIPDTTAQAGETIALPVQIDGLDGADVTAYDLTLPFDASVVEVTGVNVDGAVTPSTPTVNVTDGELRVSYSGTEALSGDGPLLTVEAQLGTAGSDVLGFQTADFFASDAEPVVASFASGIVTVEGTTEGIDVRVADVTGDAGQAVTIPIRTSSLDGQGVTAYQFSLPYDPSVLDVTGVDVTGTTTPTAPTTNVQDGEIQVSFSTAEPLTGEGTLLKLRGRLVSGGEDVLDVRNFQFFDGSANEVASTATPGRVSARPPSASSSAEVQGDGTVDFEGTGVSINFSGVSGSGRVAVRKYQDPPTDPASIPERNVSQYRYLVSAEGEFDVGSGTELRLAPSTLEGVSDPSAVTVYRRDSAGVGTFSALPTRVDQETGALVAEVSSFSEFVLASDSEPLSPSVLAIEGPSQPVSPGTAATVTVGVPASFAASSGTFFYREAGRRAFNEVALDRSAIQTGEDTTFTVEVPSEVVTRRGVQYYVQLQGQTEGEGPIVSVVAPVGAPARSGFIPVQVSEASAQGGFPAGAYRMLSVPVDLGDRSLFDVLEQQYGAYNPESWRVARWTPGDAAYRFAEQAAGDLSPGEAVWLINAQGTGLTAADVQSAEASGPQSVRLRPGWNQIGTPFSFPVAWADVERPDAVRDPVAYDTTGYQFGVPRLRPWRGAFVFNEADSAVTIEVPPVEAADEQASSAPKSLAAAAAEANEYRLQAVAGAHRDGRTLRDSTTWLGFSEGAKAGFGPKDRAKPPAVGSNVRLHVTPEEGPALARSLKPISSEGAAWNLEVGLRLNESLDGSETVTIVLDETGRRPSDFRRYVVDRDRNRRLPVTNGSVSVDVTEDQPTRRLQVIVGTDAFVEQKSEGTSLQIQETKLQNNAPNPFSERTTLSYQLANEATVRIAVYDVLGRRVQTLVNERQRAGVHEVEWRPGTERGTSLASGIYFCRMEVGDYTATRKLVFVR